MQPADGQQEQRGVAERQPQQEVRLQCPYTASSCPLFNPTFTVAEVLAAGSRSPPPKTHSASPPLAPLAPPVHSSLVDSMRSASGAGAAAADGESSFAYTNYSLAPSPETLTRSLAGSTSSASTSGSGSPPSLPGSTTLYQPPASYPLKSPSIPAAYTPLPFSTPSGFRLPSPEVPFSPLSSLEAAAFASGSGSVSAYPHPPPLAPLSPFTSTPSYGLATSLYAASATRCSYRHIPAVLPSQPLAKLVDASHPVGVGLDSPLLVDPPTQAYHLEGLEGLAAAALAAQEGCAEVEGGGRPTKRRRTRTRTASSGFEGGAEREEKEEEEGQEADSGFATAGAGGAAGGPSTSAAAAAGGPSGVGTVALSPASGAEAATPFISKLHHLLNNPAYADVIRWNHSGTAVLYSHTSPRLLEILGRFFRHTAVSSLARQLNIYQFRRLATHELLVELERAPCPATLETREPQSASEFSGFMHEGFWRDQEGRETCELGRLKPKKAAKKKSRGAAGGGGAGGIKTRKKASAGARKGEAEGDGEGEGEGEGEGHGKV